MGDLHRTINELNLSDALIVAQADASALHKTKQAWTVLTIYRLAEWDQEQKAGGLFVAEIVGETKVPGQERRVRRAPFPTLAKALNWGAFDHSSKLFIQLRDRALAWIETQARDVAAGGSGDGLVPVRFAGRTSTETALPPELEGKAGILQVDDVGRGWDGGEFGSFREAVAWLYGGLTNDRAAAARMFVEDWAAPAETVGKFAGGFYNAGAAITVADTLDVITHESEYGLPPWAEMFVRAMRHFKRESFLAARNR